MEVRLARASSLARAGHGLSFCLVSASGRACHRVHADGISHATSAARRASAAIDPRRDPGTRPRSSAQAQEAQLSRRCCPLCRATRRPRRCCFYVTAFPEELDTSRLSAHGLMRPASAWSVPGSIAEAPPEALSRSATRQPIWSRASWHPRAAPSTASRSSPARSTGP